MSWVNLPMNTMRLTTSCNHGCWVWVNEYIPSTFVSERLPPVPCHHARGCTRAVGTAIRECAGDPDGCGPERLEATVNSPEPWRLSLHAFWIPGWSATVDGRSVKTGPTDAMGVAGVEVPAGEHQVSLAFGPTPLRRVTVWVSLVALGVWLVIAWRRHWRLAAVATAMLALMVGLIGGRALAAPNLPTLTPADVNLGGKIALEGYAFAQKGEAVDVRLLWLTRQSMEESYKVFVHVIDDQGKLLAQIDSRPQQYASNTNRWIPGQVIYDRFEVPASDRYPAGILSGARRVVQ